MSKFKNFVMLKKLYFKYIFFINCYGFMVGALELAFLKGRRKRVLRSYVDVNLLVI